MHFSSSGRLLLRLTLPAILLLLSTSDTARWTQMGGLRMETFSLPSAQVLEPRASLAFSISEHQAVNMLYRRSAQLAPFMPGNRNLLPIRVQQFSAGADVWRMSSATVGVEAYRKLYTNEPVSTEYPSLMLANMVDTRAGVCLAAAEEWGTRRRHALPVLRSASKSAWLNRPVRAWMDRHRSQARRGSRQSRSCLPRRGIGSANGHDVFGRCPARSRGLTPCRCFPSSYRKVQRCAA